MNSISFSSPWLLLIGIPVLFLTVLPFLRMPKRRRCKKHTVSLVFRSISVILVVAMLSGMSVVSATDDVSIVLVADFSDSTQSVQSDMKEFIESFAESLDKDTQAELVIFADGCVYGYDLSTDIDYSDLTSNLVESDTDIEEALRYASSLLTSSDNCGRIILLSDGEETEGDAEAAAVEIAYQGIRVDTVFFDTENLDEDEVQINNVELPEDAYADETFEITVTIQSTVETTGVLNIYDDDTLIAEIEVSVDEGMNVFTLEATASGSGIHSFMTEFDADDDSVSENNVYYSYIEISGNPNILLIDGTGDESDALVELLEDSYNITVISPSDAPTILYGLYDYDEVILMNVDCDDLPDGFDEILEEYISVLGRGVLTTGGTNTYYYGNMVDTAFDDFLPVDVDLSDEEDEDQTTALVLVIDSSSSMSGEFIELAKEGAIQCVESLGDDDYVGIITFATETTVVSELTSMANADDVISAIESITTTRGTYLSEAVSEAYEQLKDSDADVKRVIILSDGNPQDSGYASTVEEMYASGIITSTICIGDQANTQIMEELAEIGGGEFYDVEEVSDLPDIMEEEVESYQVDYTNEDTFTAEIGDISEVLSGVDEIPSLDGYITTGVKSSATNVLYTGDNTPIYAEWDYGLGQVASFTSDLSGDWSEEFLTSEDGITFIENVVESLISSDSDIDGIDTEVSLDSGDATVMAEISDTSGEATVEAVVISPTGDDYTVELTAVSAGVYSGSVDVSEEGVYNIVIQQYDSTGTLSAYTEIAVASSYSEEYNAFFTGGESLLESISSIAGGEVMSDVSDLLDVELEPAKTENSLFLPLGIIAAILLLADLFMRNAKWKDLCGIFRRLKQKFASST